MRAFVFITMGILLFALDGNADAGKVEKRLEPEYICQRYHFDSKSEDSDLGSEKIVADCGPESKPLPIRWRQALRSAKEGQGSCLKMAERMRDHWLEYQANSGTNCGGAAKNAAGSVGPVGQTDSVKGVASVVEEKSIAPLRLCVQNLAALRQKIQLEISEVDRVEGNFNLETAESRNILRNLKASLRCNQWQNIVNRTVELHLYVNGLRNKNVEISNLALREIQAHLVKIKASGAYNEAMFRDIDLRTLR